MPAAARVLGRFGSQTRSVSQIPRENLTPVALPAKSIVYLCTAAADDLNGQEFSLNDAAFRARLDAV